MAEPSLACVCAFVWVCAGRESRESRAELIFVAAFPGLSYSASDTPNSRAAGRPS